MNQSAVPQEFHYKYHDLYSTDLSELRNSLATVGEHLKPGILAGPLYAWVFELAVNALKATYKRVYQATMLEPLGLDDISYEKWLDLFKTEIDEHNAENFAHYCRDNDIFVEVYGKIIGDYYRLEVSNAGVPSTEEWERIERKLERARGLDNLIELLEEQDEDEDEDNPDANRKEGGGLGISLIVVGLKGLALNNELFQIIKEDGKTISRIDIPLPTVSIESEENLIEPMAEESIPEILTNLYRKNNYQLVCFDITGHLISFTPGLLTELGYDSEEVSQLKEFGQLLNEKLSSDIFSGSRSVHIAGHFDNYRLSLTTRDKSEKILYNITGHLGEDDQVYTIWNQVMRGEQHSLSEGSFGEKKQLYAMVEPYVPSMIRHKAKEVLNFGQKSIPDELVDRTIIFADLEGFTRQSEITEPAEILGMLNKVFGIIVQRINKYGGHVEKFMGDAILATFTEPFDAVRSSIEIQNRIFHMNEYRRAGDTIEIRLRIGMNSGKVLMGNIGIGDSRDWTPLGDVVNTASRIEKNGKAGSIHLGEDTFQRLKERIYINKHFKIHAKGKKQEVKVYSVSGVRTTYEDKPAILKLRLKEP